MMRMNLKQAFGALTLAALVFSANASAEFWQTANPVRSGSFSLGAYSETYLSPTTEFQLVGQGLYGISDQVQIEVRFGFGTIDPYLGVFSQVKLASGLVDLSIWGGLHTLHTGFVDFGPIVSRSVSRSVKLYGGLYTQLPVGNGTTGVAFVPGCEIAFRRSIQVFIEAPLRLKDDYSGISAGARFNF